MIAQSKIAARPSSVTTGPVAGSQKIYTSPEGRPDIAVPFREIALHPTANEAPDRAYDTSGPFTDPAIAIDLEAGLPPVRREWLAKRGFERITARAIKPEDNGGASGDKLVPLCPPITRSRRQAGPVGHADGIRPRRDYHGRNDLHCAYPAKISHFYARCRSFPP